MYGKRYLPEEPYIKHLNPAGRYSSNALFGKQTLPLFELKRPEAMDSHQLVAVHGGSGFSFDVNFHKPLKGDQQFILPLAYKYAVNNSKTYVNFTWLPDRNWEYRANGGLAKAVSETGSVVEDAEYMCNFSGNKAKGFTGPQDELSTPFHMLFFPRIRKIDGTDFKIRCSFYMTTRATFRLYSKFPNHSTGCYNLLEAKMGQHYKFNSYQE